MSMFSHYRRTKILILSSVFVFCSTIIYLELPYYLQKHYDTNIIEAPYRYDWYTTTNFSNHKDYFVEIKKNKSINLNNALDFNMENFYKFKDSSSVQYYKNIYDNTITNIIVTNKTSYNKINFESYDKPIKDLIFNNYKSDYLDKQTFYIRENYNFKSWLYSNNDYRHNIINYSDKQIDRFSELLSSTLKSFNDEEKRNLIIQYTLAHEMAHVQDYQILTDISLRQKEVLADLSAAIYLIKELNFDKTKGNEIIDMIELFRSIPLNKKSSAGVYLPFDGLEYIRFLLNSKNPSLLNIQNQEINYLAMNVDKKKIIINKSTVKNLLNNSTDIQFDVKAIDSLLRDYTSLRSEVKTANKLLSKGEKNLTLSLAQTYKTTASRADILSQVKLDPNLDRSYKAYLASRKFESEHAFLFILIDGLKVQDNIDYKKTLLKGNNQYVKPLSQKLEDSLKNGISLNLSSYIRLSGLINHANALIYVQGLKNNKSLIPSDESFVLKLKN